MGYISRRAKVTRQWLKLRETPTNLVVLLRALAHGRCDQAWANHIGANTARSIIRCNRTREADHRAFAGSIGMSRKVLIAADHAQHRGNVDNDSMSLSQHRLQSVFTAIKNAIQIQRKGLIPAFERARISRTVAPFASAATCDVDEDVKAAMPVHYFFDR